jgi:DNA gyrase subunit A
VPLHQGPDFPTGGQILNSPDELKEIYETGSGRASAARHLGAGRSSRSGKTIYITSVPYTVNKAQLVERIADVVLAASCRTLVDVRTCPPTTCGSSWS